jgi:hypothetical protein
MAAGTMTSGVPLPIPGSSLTSLTLSIINVGTDAVINNRNQVNVLNANGGEVDEDGNFVLFLTPGDTSLADTPSLISVERALVMDWSYNGGQSVGRHKFRFIVKALGAS